MNPSITVELQFFLISILWGGILLLSYDVLRILRRMIPHDGFFIALEDFFFWVFASLFIFAMIYRVNDGVIRGFSALGVVLGGVLYHYSISDFLVRIISVLLHIIIKYLRILLTPLKLLVRKLLKFLKLINKLLFRLKNKMKSVKITLLIKKPASKKKPVTKKRLMTTREPISGKPAEKVEAGKRTKKAEAGKRTGRQGMKKVTSGKTSVVKKD